MIAQPKDQHVASPEAADAARPDGSAAVVRPQQPDDFDRDVWCVFGLPIDVATTAGAMAEVQSAARTGRRLSFVTPNVNFLVRALRDANQRRDILMADYSLADGAPLVLLGRAVGAPLPERVAGSDLFDALAKQPGFAGRRTRVFFFGGRDGSAERAAAALNASRGGLEAAGWLNPGFGDIASMSAPDIIDRINAADSDFVVVALGAAKGQAWIEANRARLNAPVIAHLGAVVDFTAGAVRRAPRWVAKAGLEWLWRVGAEPSLAKRYLEDGAALLRLAATRLPRLTARAPLSGAPAQAAFSAVPGGGVIALTGDLVAGNLDPVRSAMRAAAGTGGKITLDLSGAGAIDAAFLGLVLMLEKNTAPGAISIRGASRRARALFAANAMVYPDDPGRERTADVGVAAAAG